MLKIRIITALIIFPVTLAVVFLAPAWAFHLLVALLLLTGCWEFRRLAALPENASRFLLLLQALILALMMGFWPPLQAQSLILLLTGGVVWILMFTRLLRFREVQAADAGFRWQGFLSALAATTFCWYALSWLRDQPEGPSIVFLLLLVIWASDVGAYFSGRQFGRRPLAPVISPNKTWEGVYGGIVLAVAVAYVWSDLIAGLGIPFTALVTMTVLTTIASVGGDLFISIHKRTVGLKDTGRLFPGHGGVLDRYDSLLAGAPFFALILRVLG